MNDLLPVQTQAATRRLLTTHLWRYTYYCQVARRLLTISLWRYFHYCRVAGERPFTCPDPGCNKAFVNDTLMTLFSLLSCCRWTAFHLSRSRLQQGVCPQRGTDTSSQNPLRRASLRMRHVRQSLHAQGPPQQARAHAPRTSHERWRANGARVNFILVLPALSWEWKRHCSAELSRSFDRFHVRESALSASLLKVLTPEPFRARTYIYMVHGFSRVVRTPGGRTQSSGCHTIQQNLTG